MDSETFLAYRESALRRKAIRKELATDSSEKIAALDLRNQQVLAMYDQKMQSTELRNPIW